jgi:ADP-ribose pyrophosphatase YjhB (NUDIX family)
MNYRWKINSSRHILKDKWISVRADSCTLPGGVNIGPYYILEYPDWVNVVAVTPDNEVIFTKQYRHAIKRSVLEIPCGAVEPSDKTPMAAARRELLEETGYTAKRLIKLCRLSPNPATHSNTTHCFIALDVKKKKRQSLDQTENIVVLKVSLPDVVSMLKKNKVKQTLHVSALFYALEYLKNSRVVQQKPRRS